MKPLKVKQRLLGLVVGRMTARAPREIQGTQKSLINWGPLETRRNMYNLYIIYMARKRSLAGPGPKY